MTAVPVELPSPDSEIAVPAMLVIGLAMVPLVAMWTFMRPTPLTLVWIAFVPILLPEFWPLIVFPVISIKLLASLGIPNVPCEAPELAALPPCIVMPAPAGKLEMVFPLMVASFTLATVDALPNAMTRMPVPLEHVDGVGLPPQGAAGPPVVELVIALLEIVRLLIVPLKS